MEEKWNLSIVKKKCDSLNGILYTMDEVNKIKTRLGVNLTVNVQTPRNLFSWVCRNIIGIRINYTTAKNHASTLFSILGTDNFSPKDIIDNREKILKNIINNY